MKFEQYLSKLNKRAAKDIRERFPFSLLFASNSLGGECGELQNMIKKVYRDFEKNPEPLLHEMKLELGDILWSWNRICELLDVTPDEIMDLSIKKLTERGYLK